MRRTGRGLGAKGVESEIGTVGTQMVNGDIAGDGEKPRGKGGQVAAIFFAGAPGFFKRGGCQVFGDDIAAETVSKIVVDARQFLTIYRVPVHVEFGGRHSRNRFRISCRVKLVSETAAQRLVVSGHR